MSKKIEDESAQYIRLYKRIDLWRMMDHLELMRWRSIQGVLILLLATIDCHASCHITSVDHLATNGRINPLGISTDSVSLTWALSSRERDTNQIAYQIRIGTQTGTSDVWRSSRVDGDVQVGVQIPAGIHLSSETRYFWQVRVWDNHGGESHWSSPGWFETGLASASDWNGAKWIAPPVAFSDQSTPANALPLLRSTFNLRSAVKQARLYISAHGLYEMRINGKKVGNEFLAPGWTDYNRRIQSQTFDVTKMLATGQNAIGAALADGWYRGKVGLGWKNVYGNRLSMIAKLRVVYLDGTVEEIDSNERWLTSPGPFITADLQDGEHYDARLAKPGWDTAGYDASGWVPAVKVLDDLSKLVPQPDEPVRMTQILPARRRLGNSGGANIFDLGQNMVGVARVRMQGRAGQTVTIRYAEELYRIGDKRGQMYTANFRTAKVTDTYTFRRDGTVVYQPTFTQHGFRYIEVSGTSAPPRRSDVQGVVLGSDLKWTGDLRTSDEMLDRLVQNIRWGERSNFVSIPTDTPARDERLGWTGDINVFAPTANRYADTRAFLSKWMTDMRDAQKDDGNLPAVVPQPDHQFNQTGVGWADAMISVPYATWQSTGDLSIVQQNWTAMRRFYGFVHDSATKNGGLVEDGRSSWFSGDWLNLEHVDRLAEHRVIGTAYFAEDTRMMAEMAGALGDSEDAASWSELLPKIRDAFTAAFRQPDGTIYTGTQTVYAMALGMGLIQDSVQRKQTAAQFVAKLVGDGYHLRTGFLGTPWLLPALSSIDRNDLAMKLLLNEDYPSWGFEIRMGATTMWERWNSMHADGQFGDVAMNSFNHYAYGAVGDWMFQHLGAIQAIAPGYKVVRIAPLAAAGDLRYTQCIQRTPYGKLSAEWRRRNGHTTLIVDVPPNTTAEIVIPATPDMKIFEGMIPVAKAIGVQRTEADGNSLHVFTGSGHYRFRAR